MNEKIYPHNKIIIKKPDDIITFDYISPSAQQLFNYVVALALKQNKNSILLSAKDYFVWVEKARPQGDDYIAFYRNLNLLQHSFVIAQNIKNNKKIKYEWPLLAEIKTIRTLKNRIEKVEIKFNPYLLGYYRWQRANVPIDIDITKNLTEKYAYKLYEFLRYYDRQKGKNKYITMNDLRRILTVQANESNVRFLRYFEKALKNINETTALKVVAKIRTKNKKSLATGEIKFENLGEQIAQKQYEFLLFERDFKAQNTD